MQQYLELLDDVLENGVKKGDRTGTGTLSAFGRQKRFDLQEGFPLLTTKKLFTKGIIYELLWFLRGETNNNWLREHGVNIWTPWADEDGELGPIYGYQWRSWPTPDGRTVDQIADVIEKIKTKPNDRRMIVSAWNVGQVDEMALPPCHLLFQFWVAPPEAEGQKPRLSCQLYQRSCDLFIGVPFNIASYALLTMMVAHVTGLEPGEFVWTGGDVHIYSNHIEQVKKQLSREPRPLPTLELNPAIRDIDDFTYDDFTLRDYYPYAHIPAPVAV